MTTLLTRGLGPGSSPARLLTAGLAAGAAPPPPPPPTTMAWYPTPNNVGGALASAHAPGGSLVLGTGQGATLTAAPSRVPTADAPLVLTITLVDATTTPAGLTPAAVLRVTALSGDTIPAGGYTVLWGADGTWPTGTRVEVLLTDQHFAQFRTAIDGQAANLATKADVAAVLPLTGGTLTGPLIGPVTDRGGAVCDIRAYGARADGVTDDTAAVTAAMDAADAAGGVVFFPPGVTLVSGLVLTGRRCSFRGIGDASIIRAAAGQAGPVIDMTGYAAPSSFQAVRTFRDFSVEGDGTAGAAKVGIYLDRVVGTTFQGIGVRNTGGPCLDLYGVEFCTFAQVVCNTPVGAAAGNIPYLTLRGAANGNRFLGLGLRSLVDGPDTGVDGALRMETIVWTDGHGYNPLNNSFYGTWCEFLHLADGGCVFRIEGSFNVLEAAQFFDCSKVSGGTGTCFYRFANPPAGADNAGANLLFGPIPSSFTDPLSPDFGVEVYQSGNRIDGTKGYDGKNVLITPGVRNTTVLLGGVSSGATGSAVTDNSGNTTNVVIDLAAQQVVLPGASSHLTVNTLSARKLDTGLALQPGSYLSAGYDGSTGAPGNWIFLRNNVGVTSAGAGIYIQNIFAGSGGSSYFAVDRSGSAAVAAFACFTNAGLTWTAGAIRNDSFSIEDPNYGTDPLVIDPGSPTGSLHLTPTGVSLNGLLVHPNGSLESPVLVGTPQAPTAPPGTNTGQIATTAFVLANAGGGGGGGGTGTVTSVGLALPADFAVTGSPVTTSGTLTATWAAQAANLILAGPATGAAAAPVFRALVAADIPAIAQAQVTNLTTALAAKAPLASPSFTGTALAPALGVGVGAVAAGAALQVGGGNLLLENNRWFNWLDNAGNERNIMLLATDNSLYLQAAAGAPLIVRDNNGVERLRIDATGLLILQHGLYTNGAVDLASGDALRWSATTTPGVAVDLQLVRGSDGQLQVRDGAGNLKVPPWVAATDAATVTFDLAAGTKQTLTLTAGVGANRTLAFANFPTGSQATIELVQGPSGGPFTVTWPTVRWSGGTAPTLATAAGHADAIVLMKRTDGSLAGSVAMADY